MASRSALPAGKEEDQEEKYCILYMTLLEERHLFLCPPSGKEMIYSLDIFICISVYMYGTRKKSKNIFKMHRVWHTTYFPAPLITWHDIILSWLWWLYRARKEKRSSLQRSRGQEHKMTHHHTPALCLHIILGRPVRCLRNWS